MRDYNKIRKLDILLAKIVIEEMGVPARQDLRRTRNTGATTSPGNTLLPFASSDSEGASPSFKGVLSGGNAIRPGSLADIFKAVEEIEVFGSSEASLKPVESTIKDFKSSKT